MTEPTLIELARDFAAAGERWLAIEAQWKLKDAQAIEDVAAGKPVRWCNVCAIDGRPCWFHQTREQQIERNERNRELT